MLFPRYQKLRDDLNRLRLRYQLPLIKAPLNLRNVLYFALSVVVSGLVVGALWDGTMPREAVFMAGIFVLAALLWVTEALPLFATAILVVGLEIILLANPGSWPGLGFEQGATPDYQDFLAPIANPVLVLFFGGFLLAEAATKEGVDKATASVILRLFRGRPMLVMLGLMLATAVFSMWMSNTATTAMMITLVVPMLEQIPEEDRIRKGLVLSIPFAANIGGLGTPIASPPNAVAVGFLAEAGYGISFLTWVLIATPLMIGLLLFTWLLLWRFFHPTTPGIKLVPSSERIDGRGWYVIIIFVLTIGLWLTDRFHGLPTAVVALVPAVAFTATGLLTRNDVDSLDWDILILIAGGIGLGVGMQLTGLDQILVQMLPTEGQLVFIVMLVATLLLSTFMSNTAAANLLLPIGVSFAATTGLAGGISPMQLGISIALAASVSMALPISTPPNAIAYARGELETRDLIVSGGLVGLIALALIIGFGGPIIAFWLDVM